MVKVSAALSADTAPDCMSDLAFIIIHIGRYIATETSSYAQQRAEENGLVKPKKSSVDGSEICGNYVLTFDKTPVAAAEYSCRLASCKATFVV